MIAMRFVGTEDEDLKMLIHCLDTYYADRWGEIARQYRHCHDLRSVSAAVVAYAGSEPVGCGCIRLLDAQTAEIKRLYVQPAFRRRGIAEQIISSLQGAAADHGCRCTVLETGAAMQDAIAFYRRQGYRVIPNFGDFAGDKLSVCMKKELKQEKMRDYL